MAFSGIIVLVACLVGPPVLCLLTSVRRYGRLRLRGGSHLWLAIYAGGALLAGASLVLNVPVALMSASRVLGGGILDLTRIHAVAGALSWVCFWVWVVISLWRPARSRRQETA